MEKTRTKDSLSCQDIWKESDCKAALKELVSKRNPDSLGGNSISCPSNTNVFTYDENQCGLFQILHVVLTQLTRVTAAWGIFLMSFGNYNPGWRCVETSMTNSTQNDTIISSHYYSSSYSSSSYEIPLNSSANFSDIDYGLEDRFTQTHNSSTAYDHLCPIPNTCKEIEFEPGTVTIVTQFQLICDKAHIPSIIITIQMSGMFFGFLIAGQIGESYGRKAAIYSSTAILIVTSGLSVFSTSWEMYASFIFGIGYACGGILATFMIISTEFLGPKWRGRFASIPVSNIALGILGCIIMVCKDWVVLHLITAALSSLTFLGVFWVPESLLWLRIHGTPEQTAKVLRKIATVNKIPIQNKELVKTFIQDPENPINSRSESRKNSTICDLFRNGLRLLTIKCVMVYFCIQMSYYTIGFGVQALPGNFYTNFLLSVLTESPVSLLVGPACNGLGRKRASTFFAAISSILCAAIPAVYYTLHDELSSLAIRILAISARAMVVCIVQTFNIYMIELFPTEVRSIAFGFVGCISRVGLIMAPFLIPTSRTALPISFSLLASALVLTIACLLTLSETKNKDLHESSESESSTDTSLED